MNATRWLHRCEWPNIEPAEKKEEIMITEITRGELQQKLEHPKKSVILETLGPEEYDWAHIPGALNLPPNEVRNLASDLVPRKELEVIVYGAGPASDVSEKVAEEMTAMGYTEIRYYAGGKSDFASRQPK
jgi:rhodanese-related sulfurtransferase